MAHNSKIYNAADFGKKEEAMVRKFHLQRDDAKNYFISCTKPRLDRAYKLYIAYNGDRARQIKSWQANIFVPYIQGVVETLMPRILDARPEFKIMGRTADDQLKATKLQQLADYIWEVSRMDETAETLTRSALIYGTGYLQVSWKKDVREHKFLSSKDINSKKPVWKKKEQVFYDAPFCEWVDNYALWYDWHNIPRSSKQYWFKRHILTGAEIKRRYPMADKKRLQMALAGSCGDLTDYGSVRNMVKLAHERTVKGADHPSSGAGVQNNNADIFNSVSDQDLKMYEVFEWWRPFEDEYAVMVGDGIPILKGGSMPNPYNFKEVPFIEIPYLKLPNEFEGYGLPMLLESPQLMLNMVKNQRLDAMTLNIHKMWIVNPLANIDKKELVARPFGIVYSTDPNGVREVQFSDIKASAYREEELLKGDMRYASGVDDFSMGVGGGAGSATEVRHLRESTLERVRLFVNHLGEGYSTVMRYWLEMESQFFTKEMTIRVIGEEGEELWPLIEKDDLKGEFDYKAAVLPSIAGKADIDKKQGMDLFQLLINLPFVDPMKLTKKVLYSWGWDVESLVKSEEQQMPPGMEGAPGGAGLPGPGTAPGPEQGLPAAQGSGDLSPDAVQNALNMLGGGVKGGSPFQQASAPINLLKSGGLPPTASPIGKKSNPRGHNRSGNKPNTNLAMNDRVSNASELGQSANIQK